MKSSDDAIQVRVSEEVARALLARAIDLDLRRGDDIALAELRIVAAEAGISEESLNAAYREAIGGLLAASGHRGVSWRSIVRNAVPFAVTCAALGLLVAIWRSTELSWLLRKGLDPIALLVGVYSATRVRAKPAQLILAGFTVATGVEFLLDVAFGVPAVRGLGSHLALLFGTFAGVWLGWRATRHPSLPSMDSRSAASIVRDLPEKATHSSAPGDTLALSGNAA